MSKPSKGHVYVCSSENCAMQQIRILLTAHADALKNEFHLFALTDSSSTCVLKA